MIQFLWKIALAYLAINVLSCVAEIDYRHAKQLEHKNHFLSKRIQQKIAANDRLQLKYYSPKSEGLVHSESASHKKRIHQKPVHLTAEVPSEISYGEDGKNPYFLRGKRQKRSTSSTDIDTANITSTLFTSLNQTQKKLDEFSGLLLKLREVKNETNQLLTANFIPRLQSIENQLNITIAQTKSFNCTGKQEERFSTFANISRELAIDREKYGQQLSEWIEMLIFCRIPISETYGKKGETLLHLAAEANAVEAARLLIDKGANKEARTTAGKTPLHLAAYNNSIEVLDLLTEENIDIDAQDQIQQTALFSTAETDAVEAAQILLARHANIRTTDKQNKYAIHIAASRNSVKVLKLLIDRSSPLDHVSMAGTPLHVAANSNAVEAVRILLDHGANITAADVNGIRVLERAVIANSIGVMELLIQRKAPIDSTGSMGYTALYWAARKNNLEAAKILLANEADINCQDLLNNTPLHIAAQYKAEEVFEYLLDNNANVNAQNVDKETPYDVAQQYRCTYCLSLLKNFGAKP